MSLSANVSNLPLPDHRCRLKARKCSSCRPEAAKAKPWAWLASGERNWCGRRPIVHLCSLIGFSAWPREQYRSHGATRRCLRRCSSSRNGYPVPASLPRSVRRPVARNARIWRHSGSRSSGGRPVLLPRHRARGHRRRTVPPDGAGPHCRADQNVVEAIGLRTTPTLRGGRNGRRRG
jgi:hypothetical protein